MKPLCKSQELNYIFAGGPPPYLEAILSISQHIHHTIMLLALQMIAKNTELSYTYVR